MPRLMLKLELGEATANNKVSVLVEDQRDTDILVV